jgi:hypothetical protein
MTNPIAELANQLKAVLAAQKAEICNWLWPGLPADKVRTMFQAKGLTPPDELVQLYAWSAGVGDEYLDRPKTTSYSTLLLAPETYFDNVWGALNRYKMLASLGQDYWDKYEYPLFEYCYKEKLAVNCDPASPNFGKIFARGSEDDWEGELFDNCRYSSIGSFLRSTLACIERGAFRINPDDGDWEKDSLLFYQIMSEMEPDMPYYPYMYDETVRNREAHQRWLDGHIERF